MSAPDSPYSPDLLYTDVENDLRESLRGLLDSRCDWTAVLARCESEEPYDLGLWRTLAGELGVAGLLIPEQFGGGAASTRELGILAEELGRSVAPVPFLGSVLASTAAAECLSSEPVQALLPKLADGSRVATVAVSLATPAYASFPRAVRASGAALTGTMHAVVDLSVSDVVLVPAIDADGPALYLVGTDAPGVSRTPRTPLDLTRLIGTLNLDGAVGQRVAAGHDAMAALRTALVTTAGVLSSEQLGLSQHCLDITVEYVKIRQQFGRTIGSFQAIKHRLADLWAGVSTGRALARNAADALARGMETELAVATAQAYCSDLAVLAAEECLQLHGGIGMTWEHPAHLYLGRAKSSQLTFGIAEHHRNRIAELVELPPV